MQAIFSPLFDWAYNLKIKFTTLQRALDQQRRNGLIHIEWLIQRMFDT